MARKAEGIVTHADDRSRLTLHVLPLLGGLAVADITKGDVERVVESLDGKARAETITGKTAHNVWVALSKAFSDASSSKVLSLRVRQDNPADGVRPPDRGVAKSKQFLFPNEVTKLLSSKDVPLERRRLYALAIYSVCRASEIKGLDCDGVEVDRGILHVHQAAQRTGGGVKATKNESARKFVAEPALLPLLRALHAEADGKGRLVPRMMKVSELSKVLRADLERAGVDRAELFASDATRKWMTFHDLRATGLTWMAMRGDPASDIMEVAGHADYSTTSRYVRKGRLLARALRGCLSRPAGGAPRS